MFIFAISFQPRISSNLLDLNRLEGFIIWGVRIFGRRPKREFVRSFDTVV
jgi:hypothetical protein